MGERVKRKGGGNKMCLGIDEVKQAIDEKLTPLREAVLDLKKAVESLIKI